MALSKLVKKTKPSLVEALQEDHAHVGQAVGVDGGERHGVRIVRLGRLRLAKPFGEQRQGFGGIGEVITH